MCATSNDCASNASCDTSASPAICVPTAAPAKDGGCGCEVPGRGREETTGLAAGEAIMGLLAIAGRRRRK
jgi:hypothetical protein